MTLDHGTTTVTTEGFVIVCVLKGSFNREGIIVHAEKVRNAINSYSQKPFSMLVDDLEVEGGTPDAYEELNQLNQWVNTQNLVAKAFVIENELQKQILLQRTPALAEQNIAFFKERGAAIQWLEEQVSTHAA